VGYWQGAYTVLPIPLATKERKKVNLEGNLWGSVLEATGQPVCLQNNCP
jgi:6-phosphofructokinase 1